MDEVGLLDGDGGDELSDAELDALVAAAEGDQMSQHDAFSEFDRAFSARQAADAAREEARSAAIVRGPDVARPAETKTGWPGS